MKNSSHWINCPQRTTLSLRALGVLLLLALLALLLPLHGHAQGVGNMATPGASAALAEGWPITLHLQWINPE